MAIKFSQFAVGATTADVDFIVGYKATENVQIPIGLVTANTTYSVSTAQAGLNETLTLTGAGPASTDDITFTAGADIVLTDDGAGNGFTIASNGPQGTVTSVGSTSGVTALTLVTSAASPTPVLTLGVTGGTPGQYLQQDGNWETLPPADTYTLPITGSAAAVTATLTGNAGDTDPVLITGGTNVAFSSITAAGFTVDATDTNTTYDLTTTTTADGQTNVPLNLVPSTGATDVLNLKGAGTVTIESDSGTGVVTITGGSLGDVTSFNQVSGAASTGAALTAAGTGAGPYTGTVTVASNSYAGGANVGHVPSGGAAGQYLDGAAGAWTTVTTGSVTEVTSADVNLISVATGTTTPVLTAVTGAVTGASTNLATGTQIQTAIDTALSSALIFKGGYDASTNAPVLDSRGTPIAISVGDTYIVSVAGTFYGDAVTTGETMIVKVDRAAGASTAADWTVIQENIGLATTTTAGISSYSTAGGLAVDGNGVASIANSGVTALRLDTDSVITTKILDANVTTAKIADSNITIAKMADDSVGAAEYVDNSVGAIALNVAGDGTVGQALLSDGDGTMSWGAAGSSYTAGDGITLNALEFDLDADLTTVTSVYNAGLKVGRAVNDDYISFATDNQISTFIGNAEKMRLDSSFDLQVAGDVVAASTAFSDERLKENIKKIESPLEAVKKLNGVTYNWKETGKASVGVIAQNIQEVYPELVKEILPIGSDEKRLTVNYDGLIGLLIETVKELTEKVEKLENK